MTEEDSKLIEQFEGKIRKLVDLYDTVKCSNSELRSQLEAKDEEIRQLKEELASRQESYQNLKRSKVLEVSGHDIDDTTSPLEAGLGWITKLDAKDFIDRDFLKAQKAEGVKRKLVHFECLERAIPRNGYEICNETGETIGNVTSGIMLPNTKVGIGMGYVQTPYAKKGETIYIKIREKLVPAKQV